MRSLGRGVSLHTDETGDVTVDIYLYLEYGVSVPTVAVAIQKAVKSAVFDMAEVKTGALIVIEQEIRLDEYVRTGINVDAPFDQSAADQ